MSLAVVISDSEGFFGLEVGIGVAESSWEVHKDASPPIGPAAGQVDR
jgi:hypothetical protein